MRHFLTEQAPSHFLNQRWPSFSVVIRFHQNVDVDVDEVTSDVIGPIKECLVHSVGIDGLVS